MSPFNSITTTAAAAAAAAAATASCAVNGVVLGLHHTCSNWPMLCCRTRKLQVGRILDPLERRRGLSASFSPSFCGSRPLSAPDCHRGQRFLLQCNASKTVCSKIDGSSKEKQNHIGIRGSPGSRKRFLLRLRPRLRLISYRLRRVSVRRLVENARIIWHRNSKRLVLSAWASITLGLCILFLKCTARQASVNVPYSEFVLNLQRGYVSAVQFEEDSRYIYFNKHSDEKEGSRMMDDASVLTDISDDSEPKSPDIVANAKEKRESPTPKWKYSTRKIDHDESFLLGLMRDKGTTYSSAPQSAMKLLRSLVLTLITLWIPLAPMLWLLYRQFNANNSPAKKRRPSKQSVTFDDVEGVDAAKEELMEIVSCLQGSIDYKMLGAKLPRGVLLVGPPGTGKTLLARSVAGEAGVPFFSVSASEFVELFVGRGAARVRDLFSVAKESAPSIVFIDELDAVGGKRGRSFNDERDQTLNQLLTEMDGFESDTKVIVIAATNRPEALDPALCRPGRFSRKVVVGEPDFEGRKKILAVHLRQVPIEEETEIICSLVASLTTGLVGADLANIVNESALLAARRGGKSITREDIMEAIERAKYGIAERRLTPSGINKGLGNLFPWMPSLLKKNGMRRDGPQDLMGYQTLS